MNAACHSRLMEDYGQFFVRVYYRPYDEKVLGATPDGKEFTGWKLNGLEDSKRQYSIGIYQLRTLQWSDPA